METIHIVQAKNWQSENGYDIIGAYIPATGRYPDDSEKVHKVLQDFFGSYEVLGIVEIEDSGIEVKMKIQDKDSRNDILITSHEITL